MPQRYKKGVDREKQLDLIIDEGRAMFSTEPELSMAKLAKRVGLNGASSLYRYVRSKRELWFAVIIKCASYFSDVLEKIINNPMLVSYKEILLEMCRFFLKFSRDNFDIFKIIFLSEPPGPIPLTQKDRGPFEKAVAPKSFLIMLNIVQKAQVAEEISSQESAFITTGIIWSMLLGAAISVSPLYDYFGANFLSDNLPTKVEDPRVLLHNIAIKKIENLL